MKDQQIKEQTYKLRGFEIKRVKCTEKDCKKDIKPMKISVSLEVDLISLGFKISYKLQKAKEHEELLLSLKEFDLFNRPFPTGARKDILRKIINRVRHEDPESLLCESHIALKRIQS